jgi:hypothetical protein
MWIKKRKYVKPSKETIFSELENYMNKNIDPIYWPLDWKKIKVFLSNRFLFIFKIKKNIINKGKTLNLTWFACLNGLVGKFVTNYLVGMYVARSPSWVLSIM